VILLQDAIGNASWIELAWILTALSGLYLSRLNGMEAMRDLQALGDVRNGRWRLAVGTLRRELVRGFVNVCFLMVGLIAAYYPANPNPSLLGLAVSVVLLIASLSYNANSLLDRQDRVYLMRHGLQARDEHGRFVRSSDSAGDDLVE
jgi:hypothetical protein